MDTLRTNAIAGDGIPPVPGMFDGQLLSMIFASSNTPLAVVEGGTVILANQAFAELFAYGETQQLVGQRLSELLPAEHLCTLSSWNGNGDAINSGTGPGTRCGESHCIFNARRRNGTFARMESTCAVFVYNGRELLVMSARDISLSESHQIEREPEKRFRAIFDWAAVGISHVNLDGEIVECNRALESMLGYVRGDLKGVKFTSITHPGDIPPDVELFQELIAGRREHYQVEKRYLRKDGRTIWGHMTASLVRGAAGEPEFSIRLVEDITERKQAERELQEAQKMEAVGRLVGGVAHDFNNLLTAITLYSDLLLANPETNQAQRRHGEEIRMAADRGAALIQQLLAFVRPQAPHPEVHALEKAVADMRNMLSRLIGEHIELVTNHEGSPCPVKMDLAELQQVILNLALNARDAMAGGGRLEISIGNVAPTQLEGDIAPRDYVELRVRDTGCGMDSETRAHLFEPFFTTKAKGKGNGLGLVTVQRIVLQNHGAIRVDSELGRGTTVRVLLPAEIGVREQKPATSEDLAQGMGHKTILLVEDEAAVRESICSVLVKQGYNVLEARNGHEALNIAGEYAGMIDLVITDLVLPGIGGGEVALRLRHARPDARVLYISGYSHEASEVENAKILAKPFTGDTLARKVREALSQDARSN